MRRCIITATVIGISVLSIWFWQRSFVGGTEIVLPDIPEAELGPLGLLARWKLKAEPLEKKLIEALQRKDFEAAEKWCRELTTQVPRSAEAFYKLGAVLAARHQKDDALTALQQAVELGFRDARRLQRDEAFAELREDERFAALIAECQTRPPLDIGVPAQPADVQNAEALVADANTDFEPSPGLFQPLFKLNPAASVDSTWKLPQDAGADLPQWLAEGTAAGNVGDFYDNRDDGHSELPHHDFPQLSFIKYGPEARVLNLHWGLPRGIVHQGVVIGNASVAAVGDDNWRSMTRAATSALYDLRMLHTQFSANQIYLYPCHHDYRPGHNGEDGGHGDVYFTNTPYTVTSEGSSGSDQPFLRALTFTLAAFHPDVKQFLIEQRAISPTLQMIFRSSNRRLTNEDDYFTGTAHPPVFRQEDINQKEMIRMAHEMTRETVPPIAVLRVIEESEPPKLGREVFDPLVEERLFDTPHVIARIFRGIAERRRLVISAEESHDLNGQSLTWRWAVLCGNTDAIRITPLNEAASKIELSVPWHDRRPVEPGSSLETNRIDIGCFVNNGTYWSCPAFVTFYCPDNEQRVYDSEGRIQSVAYNANYADPMLVISKNWRDEYHYDGEELLGWTRIRAESRQEFNAAGERILSPAADGKPAETQAVRYIVRQQGRTRFVEQVDETE